jgi:hypothetical protein
MQYHSRSLLITVYLTTTTVLGAELNTDRLGDPSWVSWLWNQWTSLLRLIWTVSSLPLRPFIWLTQLIWRHLILTPYALLVQAIYIMYPVLLFCGAACICGLVIGGCSGFAAEALSSALINATWGKQPREKTTEDDDDDDTASTHSHDDDNEDYENDSQAWGYGESDMDWQRTSSRHSPASSLYRFSTSDPYGLSRPSSFYDDKPEDWQGDEDPEEIASFLRQRRTFQQQQQQQLHH